MSNPNIYKARVSRRVACRRIRGVDYEISEWGDPSRPLMFWLHGFGDCGASFQFVVDRFERDWFVVAPDWRGFGGSKTDAVAFWFPDYLADLDRLLDLYSPDAPARLVGHSMGANIGGLYAGSIPERVSAFVNVEGFGLTDTNPAEAPGRYRKWIEAGHNAPTFSSFADFAALAGRIRTRNPRMPPECAEFVARLWGRERGGRVELRANAHHKLPNAILYRRAESEACWRNVTAPVLLVAGEMSEFRTALDRRLDVGNQDLPFPGATTELIGGAGHMMHFEAPQELAAAIEAFLAPGL